MSEPVQVAAPFATHFSCSIGGSSFQLNGYTAAESAIFDAENNRIGTERSYVCSGTLWATDAATLALAIAGLQASTRQAGFDFSIDAGDTELESLDAADCADGGPTADFAYAAGGEGEGGQGVCWQDVVITVIGRVLEDTNNVVSHTEQRGWQTGADGSVTQTTRGEYLTLAAGSEALAEARVLAVAPGGWENDLRWDQLNIADTHSSYEATCVQRPGQSGGGENVIAHSEINGTRVDADGNVTTFRRGDYKTTVAGAYAKAEARVAGFSETECSSDLTDTESSYSASSTTGGGTGGQDTLRVSHRYNLESLETKVTRGSYVTDATSAYDLAAAAAAAITAPAGWTREYEVSQDNQADTEASYSVTLVHLASAYPNVVGGIYDGEYTVSTDYDEHARKVTVHSYDYVGGGAAAHVAAEIAALRGANIVIRSRITSTTHKTQRTTAEAVILDNSEATNLLELVETVTHARSGALLEEIRYPGTTPLLLKAEAPCYLYTQSGRAIGLASYPAEPPAKWAADNYAAQPRIGHTRTNDGEFETTWEYTFLFVAAQGHQVPSNRANSPGFY